MFQAIILHRLQEAIVLFSIAEHGPYGFGLLAKDMRSTRNGPQSNEKVYYLYAGGR